MSSLTDRVYDPRHRCCAAPSGLGILLCVDAREPMVTQVLDAICDPIDVLLASQYHLTFLTPGLCGPVIIKRFGNPAIMIPK
jgi:hypothetical protein